MVTQITFNEEIYQFLSFHPNGETHYGIHINGSLITDFTLAPISEKWKVYGLTYQGLQTDISCSFELNFDDVVKVVSYIRNNK